MHGGAPSSTPSASLALNRVRRQFRSQRCSDLSTPSASPSSTPSASPSAEPSFSLVPLPAVLQLDTGVLALNRMRRLVPNPAPLCSCSQRCSSSTPGASPWHWMLTPNGSESGHIITFLPVHLILSFLMIGLPEVGDEIELLLVSPPESHSLKVGIAGSALHGHGPRRSLWLGSWMSQPRLRASRRKRYG
jgi:hypothetical protein